MRGYNPLTSHLLTSWDIQVRGGPLRFPWLKDQIVEFFVATDVNGHLVGLRSVRWCISDGVNKTRWNALFHCVKSLKKHDPHNMISKNYILLSLAFPELRVYLLLADMRIFMLSMFDV